MFFKRDMENSEDEKMSLTHETSMYFVAIIFFFFFFLCK